MLKALSALQGIQSILFDLEEGSVTVIGDVQPAEIFHRTWMIEDVYIINVNDTFEPIKKIYETGISPAFKFSEEEKEFQQDRKTCSVM